MNLSLTNTTRRMKVVNLPHDVYCAALGRCACTRQPGRDGRSVPTSLTLPAGAEVAGLDGAVRKLPEIDRAIRAGELRLRYEAPALPEEPPTPRPGRRASRKSERR